MIYLNNTTDAQLVSLPHNGVAIDGDVCGLEMRNTTNKDEWTNDYSVISRDGTYLILSVILPEGIQSGEYEVRLFYEDTTICTGLAVVVGNAIGNLEYNKNEQYEQYNEYGR